MSEASKQRMIEFDQRQRRMVVEATERGEDCAKALNRIKQETFREYIEILSEYSDVPVYPLPFPADAK